MIEFNEREQEPGEDGGGLSVAVVGVGGAGANVLDRIALEGMTEAELVCMNTDIRALTNSVAATKVQLGKNLTQGLGAGGDPDLGEDAAKSSEEEIRDAVKGKDIVFVCGGLGGGTGSGAAPFISAIARSEGAFVVAFTTMPFSFEGRRRLAQAQTSLGQLRRTANALITFDNDRMGSLVLPKQGIQEAFAEADKIISQSVRAVIQLVTKPGLISIGMDDLITALDNDDSRCLFGYGQATGENRAQEALGKALKSPLLDKGEMLEEAQNVLVHICGGDSMTLFEVELLMKALEKEVSDKAQILFGVGSDPKLGDKLSVTVISSMGKPVPPTADDRAPKAARSKSGDEQEDSASAESSKSNAPESSRSEVKPDQSSGNNPEAPVAAAATTLGASMLASPTPKAEVSSSPPRARMSPIRRAMQPVEESEATADDSSAADLSDQGHSDKGNATAAPGFPGKGVISIFEDDDEDADSDSIFDEAEDDLDDDLDLMGDLGLDDEELDRLVAESASVGLEDDESQDKDDEGTLSLLEDAGLETDEDDSGGVVEEEAAPSDDLQEGQVEPDSDEASAPPPTEEEDLQDPFDETEEVFDDEDDFDEVTVVAGAAVEEPSPPPIAAATVVDPPAAETEVDEGFLADENDEDGFESFDEADELEEEFEELEVVEDSEEEFASEVEGVDDEFLDDDDEVQGDIDDDPLFGDEKDTDPAPAPKPAPSESVAAASVAPAQSNKADELLKRVGLRRAPGGARPSPSSATAQRAQQDAPEGGATRFAWSKPGTVPAPEPAEASPLEGAVESRTKLPPPRARTTAKADSTAKAAEEPAADSPFTPKGFVKKKVEAADTPRRGLPVKPTPLKLGAAPAAQAASPPVDEIEVPPVDVAGEEPEQQTFDSTLEPKHQKGRFEKGEPTVEDGEDLDLPTFLRRRKG